MGKGHRHFGTWFVRPNVSPCKAASSCGRLLAGGGHLGLLPDARHCDAVGELPIAKNVLNQRPLGDEAKLLIEPDG